MELATRELTVRFGGVTAVDRLSLAIDGGRLTGIIGPNGAGKTTFIDAVSGLVRSTGPIELDGRSITNWPPHRRAQAGIGRTFQGVELFDEFTIQENLLIPAEASRRWSFVRDLILPRPDSRSLARVAEALERVGLTALAQARPPELSLGDRKLVTIARALAGGAGLLFLDEPAAGLNSADSLQLGETLRELVASGLAVVLVDHDMGLVLGVCDMIHVLEFGKLIASGTAEEIRSNEAVIDAYLGEHGHAQTVARNMSAALEAEGLCAGYTGVRVIHDLELSVQPGEVVAIFGPNGAGKTTTLLTLSGILRPMAGTARVCGKPVRGGRPHLTARNGLAFVPDDRALFYGLTTRQNLRLAVPRRDSHSALQQVLDYFPALSELLDRRAGLLSGGEQQMLAVGRALGTRPKVLMVDEMSLGLAPLIVQRLLPVVRRIAQELGTAVLLVEQHVDLALEVADRAYVLDRGHIVISGKAEELRNRRDLLRASYMGELAYEELGNGKRNA